ncbi:MAG: selenocysteine-specific translation elongation factor [Verrucomicrobia bacterium]|nr:selenocysteine-specific translation elongation factor [Verrucomicrobiota bacterium]
MTRKNIMLGTAGHVDHGKTALVKVLTGCDTDTLAEEKQRGLTIDLGFAPCRLAGNRVVGVVDVPGHVDFIRNMVAGAHGIDVVIFVVAADDGIMPQTHEHLHVLTLMGVKHGLVALTKIDLVDDARRSTVIDNIRALLAGTFLEAAPICPLSNITGEGFEGFFDALNQVVDACDERPSSGLLRVWVEDVFTIRGSGTVVTGIPSSGRLRLGDPLHLLPAGLMGHVRRMQVYGEEAAEARAGECVAMNLPEIDHLAVKRGQVLCESDAVPAVSMAEAELRVLGSMRGRVEDYLEAHFHVGTASALARLAMLEGTEMLPGQTQLVQVRLAEPLALVPGERFVVRANLPSSGQSGLTTIGGGRILGVSNTRLRRQKQWTLDSLTARREALDDPLRWGELMLKETAAPLTLADLTKRCFLRANEVAALVKTLQAGGRVMSLSGGAFAHREAVGQVAARILAAIQSFHAANPQRAGVTTEELAASLGPCARLQERAVASLLQAGKVERNGVVLAQAGWSARVTDRDQQLCDRITAAMTQAGWATPSAEELAAAVGELLPRVERMLRLLTERGVLVRLDERVTMHRDAVEAGQQVALRLFAQRASFSTMEFRDALGVSRKFAVPLLDYLDKVRFTVRSGNHRTPGLEARKRLTPAEGAGAPPARGH